MPRRTKTDLTPPRWEGPSQRETIVLKLKLVTPLFGGGFEARNVDELVPVRAAAIRGNLRYWWRATAGARYATPKDLYEAEEALWGGAAQEGKPGGPARVALTVRVTNEGRAKSAAELIPPATPQTGPQEGIFLFPFAEQKDTPFAGAREGLEFELSIACQDEASLPEIKVAVIAWALFGGVGSRTRRGCGTLAAIEAPAWMPTTRDAFEEWLKTIAIAGNRSWPTIGGGLAVVGARAESPHRAWRTLGSFWSAFRKGHIGAIEYSPMSGGKWADARKLREMHPNQGAISLVKPFLGLPIIYQKFQDPLRRPFYGEIKPAESSRMASPVILKPIALGTSIHPLVLAMRAAAPQRIRIRDTELALSIPTDDDLLNPYKHPLAAVIKEAAKLPNAKVLRIGGDA